MQRHIRRAMCSMRIAARSANAATAAAATHRTYGPTKAKGSVAAGQEQPERRNAIGPIRIQPIVFRPNLARIHTPHRHHHTHTASPRLRAAQGRSYISFQTAPQQSPHADAKAARRGAGSNVARWRWSLRRPAARRRSGAVARRCAAAVRAGGGGVRRGRRRGRRPSVPA